jgi:hypothetical protein
MKNTARKNPKSESGKHCKLCKTTKPLSEFYRDAAGKVRAGCKDCRCATTKKNHPGYRQRNPKACTARVLRWQKRHPATHRKNSRLHMRKVRRKRRDAGQTFLDLGKPAKPQ